MDVSTFNELLKMVTPYLQKQNTRMRNCITAEERLTVTLRFLATGRSYECLKFSYGISPQSLGRIIPETCAVIFNVLKNNFFKFPTSEREWLDIGKMFDERWQFPNCGGAIDGKHIRITCPADTGALYYNYKNFYCVVLMAIVNANYEFIFADVGKNGRNSDGGVFEYTSFWRMLTNDGLHIPEREDNVEKMNYVFLADDAFPAHEHILKRFSQDESVSNVMNERYNSRHSRARNVVENAFGIINSRFRVLNSPMNIKVENVNKVVLAICALHNYLCRQSKFYLSPQTVDSIDKRTGEIRHTAEWRYEENVPQLVELQNVNRGRPPLLPRENRDRYVSYFSNKGRKVTLAKLKKSSI
ncbi:putative nuclease HARBI1 [Aricia agestis]|uniref:putative nuclease HARBI1 n=1 Tax=Aricia agestis TaxID=91739 RepID=UPI001C2039F4|nr:putative nuclease HARBI1 [Aricia agestis]